MSTSKDYALRYSSRDDRGDLYEIIERATGEALDIPPLPHDQATEALFYCGKEWTEAEVDHMLKIGERDPRIAIPVKRIVAIVTNTLPPFLT